MPVSAFLGHRLVAKEKPFVNRRLKFSPEKASLSPALFDGDLDEAEPGSGKFPSNLSLELRREVFGDELCARVGDGKENDIPPRQDHSLTFVEDLEVGMALADLEHGTLRGDEGPMIQLVASFFHQGLEGNKIQHDPGPVQLSFDGDRDLIIVAMERLSPAIGKDQEMGGGEIEVIFCDFNTEAPRHDGTLPKSEGPCNPVFGCWFLDLAVQEGYGRIRSSMV